MLGQSQKYTLSDFFGQGRFPQYPQCRRVDHIDVTTHKLRERLLAPAADVCANEQLVSVIYHSKIIHRWTENRTVIYLARSERSPCRGSGGAGDSSPSSASQTQARLAKLAGIGSV